MTQKISAANIDDTALSKLGYDGNTPSYPPKFYSLWITDSSWANTGASSVVPSTSYIKILGDNFSSPMLVYLDNTPATLVTVQSSEELRVTIPALSSSRYYTVYVVKSDGTFASKLRALYCFVPI